MTLLRNTSFNTSKYILLLTLNICTSLTDCILIKVLFCKRKTILYSTLSNLCFNLGQKTQTQFHDDRFSYQVICIYNIFVYIKMGIIKRQLDDCR